VVTSLPPLAAKLAFLPEDLSSLLTKTPEKEASRATRTLAWIWLTMEALRLDVCERSVGEVCGRNHECVREQKLNPPQSKRFSGDPPLPVAWLTPATSHRVIFCTMKRILLADEDESVRKMVARVLEIAGYLPLLAASAREVVLACRAAMPDLVVLDLTRPDEEAWQAFEQMARIDPLVPIIAITARPNQPEQALQRGIDTIMEKPLDLTLLLQTIACLLAKSEKERARRLTEHPSIRQAVVSA
jgi:CheY-like chemotaxis protein